jgi:putative PIN family toxin of toxin-antitoxin system
VLDRARSGEVELFTSAVLLTELADVLTRKKFRRRLDLAGVSADDLVSAYAALAHLVRPVALDPVILADPDDDAVLACAVASRSALIVSGDAHLLDLREFRGIRILSASGLVTVLQG